MKKYSIKLLFLTLLICCSVTAQANVIYTPFALDNSWISTTLNEDNPTEYYKITLEKAGTLNLSYQSFADAVSFTIYQDGSTTEVLTSNSFTDASITKPQTISKTMAIDKGTYILKVALNDSASNASIKMKGEFLPVESNDIEPNNTPEEAMLLAGNTEVTGHLSDFEEFDYYKITVPNTGDISLTLTSGIKYLDIYIFDLNLKEIASYNFNCYKTLMTKEYQQYLEAGTYYILIEKDSNFYSGTYKLICNNIVATSIQLDKADITLNSNDSYTLVATALPEGAVMPHLKWSSSDNFIVQIFESGNLDPSEPGIATVTATATNGTNLTASCRVVVLPDAVDVSKEEESPKSITLSWFDNNEIDGYRVYKYNSSKKKYVKYKDTTQKTIKVTKLKPEKKYKFKVAGYIIVDGKKVFGKSSKAQSFWTGPKVLRAPKITSITKTGSYGAYSIIRLKWSKVKGASHYIVYGYTPGKGWKILDMVNGTSLKLSAGRGYTYSFFVRACRTKHKCTTVGKPSKIKNYTSY